MTIAVRSALSYVFPIRIVNLLGRHLKTLIALTLLMIALCVLLAWGAHSRPREWPAGEVPVVFWSWQSDVPSQVSVQRAIHGVGARSLFLHAGQIDYQRGVVRRIRPVTGALPQGIALHLVYNATRDLLAQFERIDPEALASTICQTYATDLARAGAEGVRISGLQLDIDVPTRLLSRYERLLRMMRSLVPDGTILSITGLPTWMNSSGLAATLDAVDFWIPQCYGAEIPVRLDHAGPIASQGEVANEIDRARKIGKPFYAGLAAYGYAIHFGRDGRRVQISGSLDPGIVVGNASLELVDHRRFYAREGDPRASSEWRYVYRARENCTAGELLIRQGEWLMLDLPTSEALRATASAVRRQAGPTLLGICVFRLPTAGDATTLSVEEIADALSDRSPSPAIELSASVIGRDNRPDGTVVEITCSNTGAVSGLLGEDAFRLEVSIGGARLAKLGPNGFDSSGLLFLPSSLSGEAIVCGAARANIVRLAKYRWSPGMTASAILEFAAPPASPISVIVTVRTDESHVLEETRLVTIGEITRE